jgi:5-methylcytosine-specific restriction protein A
VDDKRSEFKVGEPYTRGDIYRLLGVSADEQGGDWDTGYHRHKDEWFIFCTVGQPGRTGHDYPNRFEGNELIWTGRTGARCDHASIQSMVSGELPVHVFFRLADREPFSYAGLAHAESVAKDKVPVAVR